MTGTRIARTHLRMMVASCVALVGLAVTAPGAWADPCPPLDLGCAVETTGSTAGGVVDQTGTTVGGVVEDTTTTVGGVVEDTTTIVEGVIGGVGPGDVGPIVEGVVPPGGAQAPTGGDTTLPGDATPPDGGGVSSPGGATPVGRPAAPIEPTRPITAARPPADVATSGTEVRREPRLLEDGRGPSLFGSRLVPVLAFPLALVLLVIGFIVVQNRIDRKDPKLALAPVETDYLTFS